MFSIASLLSSLTSFASGALNTATGVLGSILSDRRLKSDIVAVGWGR